MSEPLTSNERAFIKVSEELIRKQNDLDVLVKMEGVASGVSEWHRKIIGALTQDRVHSEDFQGISKAMGLLGNIAQIRKSVTATQERIERLKCLADAYMRGEDIIQARLSQD